MTLQASVVRLYIVVKLKAIVRGYEIDALPAIDRVVWLAFNALLLGVVVFTVLYKVTLRYVQTTISQVGSEILVWCALSTYSL